MTLFISATTAIGGIVYGAPLYLWIGFTAMTFLNARAQPNRRTGSRTILHVYLFVRILVLSAPPMFRVSRLAGPGHAADKLVLSQRLGPYD